MVYIRRVMRFNQKVFNIMLANLQMTQTIIIFTKAATGSNLYVNRFKGRPGDLKEVYNTPSDQVQYNTIQYNTTQFNSIPFNLNQIKAIQCNTILFNSQSQIDHSYGSNSHQHNPTKLG